MTENSSWHPQVFPTTHWSQIGRAGQADTEARRQALGDILSRYFPALRTYLILEMNIPCGGTDDLLQGFVASKVLGQQLVEHAKRGRGRFRTWVIAALRNHVLSTFRHERAQKRSPGTKAVIDIDDHPELASADGSHVKEFDIQWARDLLSEALERMKAECLNSGRQAVWGIFEHRVVRPKLERKEELHYSELVQRYGLKSPSEGANLLVTAKRMFQRVLKSVVAEYARDGAEIDEEILDLKRILSESGAR